MTAWRTFTESEQANRDAWVSSRVANDCGPCESDGEWWQPTRDCPVHGEHCEPWWADLNRELDERWPGTWHRTGPKGKP